MILVIVMAMTMIIIILMHVIVMSLQISWITFAWKRYGLVLRTFTTANNNNGNGKCNEISNRNVTLNILNWYLNQLRLREY